MENGHRASVGPAKLRRQGSPEPAMPCCGGFEWAAQAAGPKGRRPQQRFLRSTGLGIAQKADDQARAGSQAPFHSVLGQQGRGLFFVSILDYYLTIIRGFSRGSPPGAEAGAPQCSVASGSSKLYDRCLPGSLLPISSMQAAIPGPFAYYLPIM